MRKKICVLSLSSLRYDNAVENMGTLKPPEAETIRFFNNANWRIKPSIFLLVFVNDAFLFRI